MDTFLALIDVNARRAVATVAMSTGAVVRANQVDAVAPRLMTKSVQRTFVDVCWENKRRHTESSSLSDVRR